MPAANQRILERLLEHHEPQGRSLPVSEKVVKSVSNYLLRLFNTRQGSVLVDANFGVPSLQADTRLDETAFIAKLRAVLLQYEPRILQCDMQPMATKQVQVLLKLKLTLKVKSASVYDASCIDVRLMGSFMADGTFRLEQEDVANYV